MRRFELEKPKARTSLRNLTKHVTEALAKQIASQGLQPGDRLPTEREMITEFNVSRTVIRDAIARLREQGMVESRQGAGVFVRAGVLPPGGSDHVATISAIVETIEVRAAIEIEAARLAVKRGSPAQLANIGEKWDDLRRAGTPADAEAADLQFHLAIARATNNSRFVEFFDFLGSRTIPRAQLRHLDKRKGLPSDYDKILLEEHRVICDAILSRDSDAAGEAMRVHLRSSQERYFALIRSNSS